MEPAGLPSGNRVLDRPANEVMGERQPVAGPAQEATLDALVHGIRARLGHHVEQRRFDPGADDRSHIEDGASRVGQGGRPGQHRVADRGRHPQVAAGQRLDHEERVALGTPVELVGVNRGTGREQPDGFPRQRLQATRG